MSDTSYSSNVAEVDWWSGAETDLFTKWAQSYDKAHGAFNNPYFDYFFTGQDIQVSIDGLTSINDTLPIYSFGYNIQQQKTPLYGFWSYTFDYMLRGTRIISGAFSIVSLYPTYLTEQIAKAASFRAKISATGNMAAISSFNRIRGLDDDETRIDRYWRRNYDSNLDNGQQHLFSVHPPFNFVIKYGIQDVSTTLEDDPNAYYQYRTDATTQDHNERLVQSLPGSPTDMSILLENIELTSKSVEYNVDGDPLLETYTFLARDERFLKPVDKTSLQPAVPDPVTTTDQVGMPTSTANAGYTTYSY